MEIHKFLSHDFSVKDIEKFREINVVMDIHSKMVFSENQFHGKIGG